MKKFYLSMQLCFLVLACGAQVNLQQGLLVHYPFDGNTNDISGNNFHATGNATVTSDRHGNANGAYHFNGVNQFIDMPNNPQLKPQLPLTVALWVKFEQLAYQKAIMFTTDYTEDLYYGVYMTVGNDGRPELSYGDGGPSNSQHRRSKVGNIVLQTNRWYLIVGVIRGPLDMDLYVDCENVGGTYSGSGGTLAYSQNPGSIGRIDGTSVPPYYFQGSIDDFRYWNRALTADEVRSLCPPQPTCLISENFSSAEGFQGVNNVAGNGISITNGKLHFNNVQDGNGIDRRMWKRLGDNDIVPDRFSWDFEFNPTLGTQPVGHYIALTDSNMSIPNIYSGGNYLHSNQDAVGVFVFTNEYAPLNPQMTLFVKDGTTSYIYDPANYYARVHTNPVFTALLGTIPMVSGTNYYLRVEKFSENSYRLSAYLNVDRTVHATGSPICLRIPQNIQPEVNGLNYFQASNSVQGTPARRLTATVDNVCINALPDYPYQIAGPRTVCQGGNATFTVSGLAQGQSVAKWENPLGSEIVSSTANSITLKFVSPNGGSVSAYISNACDSLKYTTSIQVVPATNTVVNESFCEGGSFSFEGHTYTEPGTYVIPVGGSSDCPATVTLNLSVKPRTSATFNRTICQGEFVTYGGQTFTTTGTHMAIVQNAAGCDSVITVHLNVLDAEFVEVVDSVCINGVFVYNGQEYAPGVYFIPAESNTTCGGVVILHVGEIQTRFSEYHETICYGQSVTYGGQTFSTTGLHFVDLTSSLGCDSVIALHLTVTDVAIVERQASVCGTEIYTLPNGEPALPGYNTVLIEEEGACPYQLFLYLTVNEEKKTIVNASVAQGEWYTLPDGKEVNIAGKYKTVLQSSAGCDSTVVTHLSITAPPAGGCYAVSVESFTQGTLKNGSPVTMIRSNPSKSLGAPETVVNGAVNFVSLGFGGQIVLAFEGPVANGPGADIRIHEATWDNQTCNSYPERAEVFASQNNCDWVYIGTICTNGGDLDLGPLSWAQYIKIHDITSTSYHVNSADGFDVNAVECLNGPGTIADDGLVAGSVQTIVEYNPGTQKNGAPLPAARTNTSNATGMPGGDGVNFVSLGFAGSLIGRFDYVVFNQPGPDLKVIETSYGNPSCANYPEYASYYGSADGVNWTHLGLVCQDGEIDLGDLYWIQYIKIVDESLILSSRFNGAADGYDVDGIATIQNCSGARFAEVMDNVTYPDDEVGFSAYPNPVQNVLNISLSGLESDETISVLVYDAAGRVVVSERVNATARQSAHTINCSTLAPGVYQVIVETGNGFFSERIVK